MSIEKVKSLFTEYARERPWVQSFNWQNISIGNLPVSKDCPVCAMYLALSDKILIDQNESEGVVFILFCHEMRHAYQRHSMGLVKYLFMKVFFRSRLEAEAADIETDAADWMAEYYRMNNERT